MIGTKPEADGDLDPKKAARALGVKVETVRRYCRAGLLGYRIGERGPWRITRAEIEHMRAQAAGLRRAS